MISDGLIGWIAEVRGRVDRGALDGITSIDIDGATVVGSETIVRNMLAALAHCDDLSPERRLDLLVEARRRMLLRDFAQLRKQIG